jgi:anaerobic magnesium-protoporphyrin IX monomethyl ester cyclase
MAKLLLCNPLFLSQSLEEQALKSPYFPLGLLYLAAYLREHNHTVTIFDGTFQPDVSTFLEMLQQESPDVVGITALLPTKAPALKLAAIAHDFGATVILGGPDPTRSPKTYLACPQVDLVAHHEGEETLLALLDLFDEKRLTPETLQNELGVAYRDPAGEIILNPPRPN